MLVYRKDSVLPSKVKFTASFLLAFNPETGEEFVLYSDKEIAEREKVMLANVEQAIDAWPPTLTEESIADQKKAADAFRASESAALKAKSKRFKADRDGAMDTAETLSFVVCKPTWGEHLEAIGKANVLNEDTGQATFDENVYVRELLPLCIEDMKAKDVLDLSPTVAGELRFRFLRAVSPNENRLPFTSPLPEAS
jgi:hypothetical protein